MDPNDPRLPAVLGPLAVALDPVPARHTPHGWQAHGYDAPPAPLRPGAPPDDGIYRGSWISPGICLRLDLAHPCVPLALRERLVAMFPEQIGPDGALYEYGVDGPSQHRNRAAALAVLANKVR